MFQNLSAIPYDSLFQTVAAYKADTNPEKIDLSIGVVTNQSGKPFVFPSVQAAAKNVPVDNFQYLPLSGDKKFLHSTAEFFFRTKNVPNLAMQQVCGGTHACRVFADLSLRDGLKKIFVGTPTWGNHFGIFKNLDIQTFDHLDASGEVSVENYLTIIKSMNAGDILLLQGGASHNPTGKNLSLSDLEKIVPLLQEKSVTVFIDFAYFGLGDQIETERKWLSYIFENLRDVALGVSYSKNASLYQHRMGALLVKTDQTEVFESHLQNIIRQSISNPPAFGSNIMNQLFENQFDTWTHELEQSRLSIADRREQFCQSLGNNFESLKKGKGMFGLLPLNESQVTELRKKYSLYFPPNGRINFAGIPADKIQSITEKIRSVL